MKSIKGWGVGMALTLMVASPVNAAGPVEGQLTADEVDLLSARLAGAKRPRLALAMSGGGIRSSLFNIGVLKALYDHRVLDDVDLVSSVSGGSYANYWMYINELAHPGQRFGEYSFDDRHFPERVCELMTAGNFVTYPRIAASSVLGMGNVRRMYRGRIIRTYGVREQHRSPVSLHELEPLVRTGRVPYPIFNATINQEGIGWAESMFEFTPVHFGTHTSGLQMWNGTNAHAVSAAVAASGAALGPLSQPFAGVRLWDGGKSENLGAAAALRRGPARMIVIDAQLDPPHRPFEAYARLQTRIDALGYRVAIPAPEHDLDDMPASFTGRVDGPHGTTETTYLKMRIGPQLRREFESGSASLKRGATASDGYYETLERRNRWQCADLSKDSASWLQGASIRDWLASITADYSNWSDGNGARRIIHRLAPDQREFPTYTTTDQSFKVDQTQAYVGLGYLVASDALSRPGKRGQVHLSQEGHWFRRPATWPDLGSAPGK